MKCTCGQNTAGICALHSSMPSGSAPSRPVDVSKIRARIAQRYQVRRQHGTHHNLYFDEESALADIWDLLALFDGLERELQRRESAHVAILDVAGIRARLAAISPGEWLEREDGDYYQGGTYLGIGPFRYKNGTKMDCQPDQAEYFHHDICRIHGTDAEKEFIKQAPADLRALLAAVEGIEREYVRSKLLLEQAMIDYDSLRMERDALARQFAEARAALEAICAMDVKQGIEYISHAGAVAKSIACKALGARPAEGGGEKQKEAQHR